jgi:hypothetical protein
VVICENLRPIKFTALLDLLLPAEPAWELMRPHLERLNVFSVQVRYPGESADKSIAREAISLSRKVRSRARMSLGLAGEK